ncbi:MAG: hypothetical protein P8Z76_16560 [Alphaproteobacteria bacterium]
MSDETHKKQLSQSALRLGIAETMQAGGWKSPAMVGRYSENQQARRGAMSKLAAKQGRL